MTDLLNYPDLIARVHAALIGGFTIATLVALFYWTKLQEDA